MKYMTLDNFITFYINEFFFQNVFLASSGGGSPAVVLTSPAGLRTQQGGTLVLQPGAAQQIVLPHGFQGGTLNFKSLQGLQGIRVIPLAQASAAASSSNTSMPKGMIHSQET